MEQVIPFNQSKGGNVHNLCLANVCAGFGIPNKYESAWQAWEHTQQHTDAIPSGLDVPLFYSYTATIDGVTQNWGHTNVRLANGTVWSDGTVYANLDRYLSSHYPKFVGWGESVNDVQIIKENDMFKGRTAAQWAEIATKNQVALNNANAQLVALKAAPVASGLDPTTEAEIANTNSVVNKILSILQKIFIGSK